MQIDPGKVKVLTGDTSDDHKRGKGKSMLPKSHLYSQEKVVDIMTNQHLTTSASTNINFRVQTKRF